jgi:hypothetical protein
MILLSSSLVTGFLPSPLEPVANPTTQASKSQLIIIIISIIISCHRFSFFPGTSALEPVVNPTTQASSLSL